MSEPDIATIKKQVEFYFSDSNYRIDTFLNAECAHNDGWLPIATLLKFKRLSTTGATVDAIKDAVKESTVVETNASEQIRKIITDEYKSYVAEENIDQRVIGIRGLDVRMTLEDIEKLLCAHMKPKLIRMRRDRKKQFNGSVLVELGSPKEAKEALGVEICVDREVDTAAEDERLDSDKVKKAKMQSAPLKVMTKADFLSSTKEEAGKEKILNSFSGKMFTYECGKDMSIKEIKKLVPDVAFVDTRKMVMRFKNTQDFEKKIFDADGAQLTLCKMGEGDSDEYVKTIKVTPSKKGNKK